MNCNIHHNSVKTARSNQKKTEALGITASIWQASFAEKWGNKKAAEAAFLRGPERIRTAVAGFADLSLATRPQDPVC